jgi:hypothetical protein
VGLFGGKKRSKEETKAKMAAVKKVAIVSAVIDDLDPGNAADRAVQAKLMERAMEVLAGELKHDFGFEVLPPASVKGHAGLASALAFAASPKAKKEAEEPEKKKNLVVGSGPNVGAMADVFQQLMANPSMLKNREAMESAVNEAKSGAAATAGSLGALQDAVAKLQKFVVGAEGFPEIPFGLFELEALPEKAGVKFGTSKDNEAAVADVAAACISEVCAPLGVDAVVVAYFRSKIEVLGTIPNIRTDLQRSTAAIRMNGTGALISKEGELLGKLDNPRLDDFAPKTDEVPVYKGIGSGKTLDLSHQLPTQALVNLVHDCAKKISDKLKREIF